MSKPIKKYSVGQVSAAVFENEYKGKKTYSIKFQKSYLKDEQWVNTEFFNETDMRSLCILVNVIAGKQLKETVINE